MLAATTLALLAACGGAGSEDTPPLDPGQPGSQTESSNADPPAADAEHPDGDLAYDGGTVTVPTGWDARVLPLDPTGARAVLQLANFDLPDQRGFEPPAELPAGEQDPIKAMSGNDVLISLIGRIPHAAGPGCSEASPAIGRGDFLPEGAPRVPRGHALARRPACVIGHSYLLDVDFAEPPGPERLAIVNEVLASLALEPDRPEGTRQTAIEPSGPGNASTGLSAGPRAVSSQSPREPSHRR